MATLINMPKITVKAIEGVIIEWHVKRGDKVYKGDKLAVIESDRMIMDIEATNMGIILFIAVEERQIIPTNELLVIIGEEGEYISDVSYQTKLSEQRFLKKDIEISKTWSSIDKTTFPEGIDFIYMPKINDWHTEYTVITRYKNVGDTIEEGDILYEIETDKTQVEIESYYDGILLHTAAQEGETFPVDELLAIIGPAEAKEEVLKIVKPITPKSWP